MDEMVSPYPQMWKTRCWKILNCKKAVLYLYLKIPKTLSHEKNPKENELSAYLP